MGLYLPVVTKESDLRPEVEGLLTDHAEVITERLDELDDMTESCGNIASFGAEIEFQFVPDPEVESQKDQWAYYDLYNAVLESMGVSPAILRIGISNGARRTEKGEIVPLDFTDQPVLYNYREDLDYFELRTAPARSNEAAERYWNCIKAIGQVASDSGHLGIVLSTHISSAIDNIGSGDQRPNFINFQSSNNFELLAAVQNNLNRLYPLQLDSGVEAGVVVLEAFPYIKDATTTLHDNRFEFRHPSVGVADPRIDMLAVLDGLHRTDAGEISQSELDSIKQCYELATGCVAHDYTTVGECLFFLSFWDNQARKFVLPTRLEQTSREGRYHMEMLERAFGDLTNTDHSSTNEHVCRKIISQLTLSDVVPGEAAQVVIRPKSSLANDPIVRPELGSINVAPLPHARILPIVIYDSPERHFEARGNIKQSSVIRRILGPAATQDLVGARQSTQKREQLLEDQMVYAGDDE